MGRVQKRNALSREIPQRQPTAVSDLVTGMSFRLVVQVYVWGVGGGGGCSNRPGDDILHISVSHFGR